MPTSDNQAYLQEQGYTLSNTILSGASAGALSATLAKTNVCPYDATKLALSMSAEAGIWDRPLGLQGVWGSIIYDWLNQLLPEDAEEKVKDEVGYVLCDLSSIMCTSQARVYALQSQLLTCKICSFSLWRTLALSSTFLLRQSHRLERIEYASLKVDKTWSMPTWRAFTWWGQYEQNIHYSFLYKNISFLIHSCCQILYVDKYHIVLQPWFLDGNLTSNFRGKPHIDGSFLAQSTDYLCEIKYPTSSLEQPRLVLDYKRDPVMKDRSSEFIKLVSEQGIWDILEQGKKHAKVMDQNGEFDVLRRNWSAYWEERFRTELQLASGQMGN